LLTRSAAASELIEISSLLAEDAVVLEVCGSVVRPTDVRVDADVDVHSDTVGHPRTLAQTRLDVGHPKRVGLFRSQRVRVIHYSPRRTTHYTVLCCKTVVLVQ